MQAVIKEDLHRELIENQVQSPNQNGSINQSDSSIVQVEELHTLMNDSLGDY